MPTSPSTQTRITEQASAVAGGTDRWLVFTPCVTTDDMVPRQFGSAQAIKDFHGYCPGVEFASHFAPATRKPLLVVGMPITTPGAVSDVDTAGNTGTAAVAVAAAVNGVLYEHEGSVRVLKGGTLGTDAIVLEISLDGGRNYRPVRVGTALSYALEQGVVLTLGLAAETLVAGDIIATWTGSNPVTAPANFTTAREKLEAQQKRALVGINVVDCEVTADAQALATFADTLETSAERYMLIRGSLYDKPAADSVAAWVADLEGDFAAVLSERRNFSAGRARRLSPWSGYEYRIPAQWFITIREAQHDLHIPTWQRKEALGVSLEDLEGQLVEYDDRVDGGALVAAGFSCLTTRSNRTGVYVARDLTGADESSLLANAASAKVTFLVQGLVQDVLETAATGEVLVLKTDGSGEAEPASLSEIETIANAVLAQNVLTDLLGEGPRASGATLTCNPEDAYNVPEPVMNTTTELTLNGIVHTIRNKIAVQR